jgi:hypothetical protein
MMIQSVGQIGDVLRNGMVFDTGRWSGGIVVQTESLIQSVREFFALLEERQIDYALVGGIALLHYVEGRNTQDLDLLMAAASLEQLPELTISDQDNNFIRGHYNQLQIDLLLTENSLFRRVYGDYTTTGQLLDQEIPLATVEGLILLKLYALPSLYRQGEFARVGIYENDIATLLHYYSVPLAPILAELAHHLSATDQTEIREILSDIQRRISRFSREE